MSVSSGIWAAVAEVRVPAEDVPEGWAAGPGFILAFLPADSQEAGQTAFEDWLRAQNVELIELSGVKTLEERWQVDEDEIEAAFESRRSGLVTSILNIPTDPARWDEDPDADLLRASVGRHDLVWFRYLATDTWELGFVVNVSDDWVLVHAVDEDRITLNGYVAVRLRDIIDAQVVEDDDFFVRRALELVGDQPGVPTPEIPLASHQTIFAAVRQRFSLVRFSLDSSDSDIVGRITEAGPDAVTIEGVSRAGEWVGSHEYAYDDIFAILFGRDYENALTRLLGDEPCAP